MKKPLVRFVCAACASPVGTLGRDDKGHLVVDMIERNEYRPVAGERVGVPPVRVNETWVTLITDPRVTRRQVADQVAQGLLTAQGARSVLNFGAIAFTCKKGHDLGVHLDDLVDDLNQAERTGRVRKHSVSPP